MVTGYVALRDVYRVFSTKRIFVQPKKFFGTLSPNIEEVQNVFKKHVKEIFKGSGCFQSYFVFSLWSKFDVGESCLLSAYQSTKLYHIYMFFFLLNTNKIKNNKNSKKIKYMSNKMYGQKFSNYVVLYINILKNQIRLM